MCVFGQTLTIAQFHTSVYKYVKYIAQGWGAGIAQWLERRIERSRVRIPAGTAFIEPCFGIGHNLSLICQMTSEDIKHQLIIIIIAQGCCESVMDIFLRGCTWTLFLLIIMHSSNLILFQIKRIDIFAIRIT